MHDHNHHKHQTLYRKTFSFSHSRHYSLTKSLKRVQRRWVWVNIWWGSGKEDPGFRESVLFQDSLSNPQNYSPCWVYVTTNDRVCG